MAEDVIEDLKTRGSVLFAGGDYAAAKIVYSQALELDPSSPSLHANRSATNLCLGYPHYALADAVECCLSLATDWPKGFYRAARACLQLKCPESAKWFLLRAHELNPTDGAIQEMLGMLEATNVDSEDPFAADMWVYLSPSPPPKVPADVAVGFDRVTVRESEKGGRGLFAQVPIAAGEVIFEDDPVAFAHLSSERCDHCFVTSNLIRCQCGVQYCSVRCREDARARYHEALCERPLEGLRDWCSKVPGSAGHLPWLLTRVAGYTMQHDQWPCRSQDLPEFRELADATVMASQHRREPFHVLWKHFQLVRQALGISATSTPELAVYFDLEWFEVMYNKLAVNVFAVSAEEEGVGASEKSVGCAVLRLGSFMNHSCTPTARCGNGPGRTYRCVARCDISQGSEITISYTPRAMSYAERGNVLLKYGFLCKCPACLREQENNA